MADILDISSLILHALDLFKIQFAHTKFRIVGKCYVFTRKICGWMSCDSASHPGNEYSTLKEIAFKVTQKVCFIRLKSPLRIRNQIFTSPSPIWCLLFSFSLGVMWIFVAIPQHLPAYYILMIVLWDLPILGHLARNTQFFLDSIDGVIHPMAVTYSFYFHQ